MVQAGKHVVLIITLLAWVVFPLPECYLTKPHCPKRYNSSSCQAFNQRQPIAQAPEDRSCCGATRPGGGHDGATTPRATDQDGERLLVANLSPRFLLPDSPDLPGPATGFNLLLPALAAPTAVAGFYSPYRGERPDPIPILLRTQTFLI